MQNRGWVRHGRWAGLVHANRKENRSVRYFGCITSRLTTSPLEILKAKTGKVLCRLLYRGFHLCTLREHASPLRDS